MLILRRCDVFFSGDVCSERRDDKPFSRVLIVSLHIFRILLEMCFNALSFGAYGTIKEFYFTRRIRQLEKELERVDSELSKLVNDCNTHKINIEIFFNNFSRYKKETKSRVSDLQKTLTRNFHNLDEEAKKMFLTIQAE